MSPGHYGTIITVMISNIIDNYQSIMITYTIDPRPDHLGGGWKVAILDDTQEIAGGVFPAGDEGYTDALDFAESFLQEQ